MPHYVTQEFAKRFEKTYRKLPDALQRQVDKTITRLIEDPAHPGLNVHPIKDALFYWEAYVNRGDRLIYRPEGTHLIVVDVVRHDDIGRYSKAPR
jgi:mRNA-degrading endonuclease RelE of RelBE toxin-antitoxin system